jgi:hypothetical protein
MIYVRGHILTQFYQNLDKFITIFTVILYIFLIFMSYYYQIFSNPKLFIFGNFIFNIELIGGIAFILFIRLDNFLIKI